MNRTIAVALVWGSGYRLTTSGTYIVRLETESGVEARKVSLIRLTGHPTVRVAHSSHNGQPRCWKVAGFFFV